jgi:GNAT superfamily N-acetyltransferase
MNGTPTIERLLPPASESDLHALAGLLVEAVESGAAVSFLAPLPLDQAVDWWRQSFETSKPKTVFLVARNAGEIVGTVQLQPAWAPNQPRRADIVKLLVARSHQGQGLAKRLMERIETEAQLAGFTLLTLDAKGGGTAERLYRRSGWTCLGAISEYALDPDGTPHEGVFFYKHLDKNS